MSNKRQSSSSDVTAFHFARGESDPGWVPLDTKLGEGLEQRYYIGHEIGRGGMGVVYEAWDLHLQRSVAIKLMDEAQRERSGGVQRFFREARIASRIEHPGIVPIYEFGVTSKHEAFIVMQLLTGQTFRQVLAEIQDRNNALPSLVSLFYDVCQAIASAHDAGVIHRDLKPSNIMVAPFGVVTVMDWGVAKTAENDVQDNEDTTAPVTRASVDDTSVKTQTRAGTVFGTPSYLAPEQARGELGKVDCRADVFGLGSILCEILTGSATFVAPDSDARWQLAKNGDTTDACNRLDRCEAPSALITLAKHCLSVDPHDRPADARAVVDRLSEYFESGRRKAEYELLQFFDLSVDLFCITTVDGRLKRTNENFLQQTGLNQDILTSGKFIDFVHPDDQLQTRTEFEKPFDSGVSHVFTSRFMCASGGYTWLEWNVRKAFDEGEIYVAGRDVSDRIAAIELRKAMEQERAKLAAFGAAIGLFLTSHGALQERIQSVVEEGVSQLDVVAMEVWNLNDNGAVLQLLASEGLTKASHVRCNDVRFGQGTIGKIAQFRQPLHVEKSSPEWENLSITKLLNHNGIVSFVGYPLLIADQPVGVLTIYDDSPISELLVTAMSGTVASLALAIKAGEIE